MKVTYEKDIQCPFYRTTHVSGSCKNKEHIEELKKHAKSSIKCEGLYKKSSILLEFSHETARKEHKLNFCASPCWRGCPIALMLNNTKYEDS